MVTEIWNYCNIPRDDGLSYVDYDHEPRHECANDVLYRPVVNGKVVGGEIVEI